MHVLAGEVVGVFAHVERADQHRAGRFQPLDQGCVAWRGRPRAIDLGAGDGGKAFDIEQVLDREGHAGERQFGLVAHGVDGARPSPRAIGGNGGEGVERRIALFDARKRIVHHAERARPPGADRLRDRGRFCPG